MNNYTGVGSRLIDDFHTKIIHKIALSLSEYNVRTGDAIGADRAFHRKAKHSTIYQPTSNLKRDIIGLDTLDSNYVKEAYNIAQKLHPAWDRLDGYGKSLMARNVFQVLGNNLDNPSDFLICYTPDGCEHGKDRTYKTGGTGMAIAVASDYNVPIYNIKKNITKKYLDERFNLKLFSLDKYF